MKKITLLAVTAIAVLSMSSCRKDRTCTCTDTTSSGGTSSPSSTTTVVVKKSTKSAAAGGPCWSGTNTGTNTYGGTTVTTVDTRSCTIK
jgi:hypothetical protein